MKLYSEQSSDARYDAQKNLSGRTHYVDDDTLRFHKSRILKTTAAASGLLFGLVESVALDMHNTKRGFRAVVFDVFGTCLSRASLEDARGSKQTAEKDLDRALASIDAIAHTLKAIEASRTRYAAECDALRSKVLEIAEHMATVQS